MFYSHRKPFKWRNDMNLITVAGKTAVRIKGKVLLRCENASKVNCDGDIVWLPNTTFEEERGTVKIQEWIFKKKFPNG
jgi:hypothetical protein